MPQRPQTRQAIRVSDDMGRMRTLSSGAEAYELLLPPPPGSRSALLLGLGPYPHDAPLAGITTVHVLEAPAFAAAMPPFWQAEIPAAWRRVAPDEVLDLARGCAVWRYRQGVRLFSAFWSPLLAQVLSARLNPLHTAPSSSVLLPGDAHALLTLELEQGLREAGLLPVLLPADNLAKRLPALLHEERPAFLLSVNGRGLDADGLAFHLLQTAGVPVAIWLVDNPWHVCSAWRQPWWRDAHLFVTDSYFVPDLQRHGARRVTHLPLGAWMPPGTRYTGPKLNPLVFVGRSAFPDKRKFFSGLRLDPHLLEQARACLVDPNADLRQRPDFSWWTSCLGLSSLWPGMAVRQAGFGAETCSQWYRSLWLRTARDLGLTVFGDDGWLELLTSAGTGPADIRPPLDYYVSLSSVYASARYSLNLTSMLLPFGLTQRHFDVWTAGGFLLTDSTPGMDIFPDELTAPIRLSSPRDLPDVVKRLERDPALYRHLQIAWRNCMKKHTIRHRILMLLRCLQQNNSLDDLDVYAPE